MSFAPVLHEFSFLSLLALPPFKQQYQQSANDHPHEDNSPQQAKRFRIDPELTR